MNSLARIRAQWLRGGAGEILLLVAPSDSLRLCMAKSFPGWAPSTGVLHLGVFRVKEKKLVLRLAVTSLAIIKTDEYLLYGS